MIFANYGVQIYYSDISNHFLIIFYALLLIEKRILKNIYHNKYISTRNFFITPYGL